MKNMELIKSFMRKIDKKTKIIRDFFHFKKIKIKFNKKFDLITSLAP